VLFEGHFSFQYVKYFIGMATRRLKAIKGVTILRADRVTVSALAGSRAYVQIDGEYAGHLPAEVRIVPEAVTLLLPPKYGK